MATTGRGPGAGKGAFALCHGFDLPLVFSSHGNRYPVADGDEIGILLFLFQASPDLADVLTVGGFNGEEPALGFDYQTFIFFVFFVQTVLSSSNNSLVTQLL